MYLFTCLCMKFPIIIMCVHTVFEQNVVIPFFFYTFLTYIISLHPLMKYQSKMTNPFFFSICIRDVIQVEQKCYACIQKWYTYCPEFRWLLYFIQRIRCKFQLLDWSGPSMDELGFFGVRTHKNLLKNLPTGYG